MAIRIVQTCDKCKKERELSSRTSSISQERQLGGWRELDGKDICPDDIKKLFS